MLECSRWEDRSKVPTSTLTAANVSQCLYVFWINPRCQCVNVMEVLALPLQLRLVVAPASPLPSAGSSRLRSFVLSWIMHWSQSSGSRSMRKPRQMMNTAIRRTVLKSISQVYRSTTGKSYDRIIQVQLVSKHLIKKTQMSGICHASVFKGNDCE